MVISFEQLGWYFAWDKEGRYPIDPTQPVTVPNKSSLTMYLVNRKKQNEDGTWEEWFVVSDGEKQHYESSYWGGETRYYINKSMQMKYQIIAGQKKINFIDLNFSNYAIEELFIGNNVDREDLLTQWPNSLKKITDFTDVTNGCYIKFSDLKNKLGGDSTFGNKWITVEEIADYVDGVNYEMIDLRGNNLTVQSIPYKNNSALAFLGKLLKESYEDIELYKDLFTRIYWNAEDQGVYMENTPLVGELQITKLSASPIFVDDNIYIALIKTANKIQFNCNGNTGEINVMGVDYLEEYVESNNNISLDSKCLCSYSKSNCLFQNEFKRLPYSDYEFITKNFTNWENRGNFINQKQIEKIFPGLTQEIIDDRGETSVDKNVLCDSILYKNPIEVIISNITEPFYITAILNPVKRLPVVKRTWRVENNELVYEDKVYVV